LLASSSHDRHTGHVIDVGAGSAQGALLVIVTWRRFQARPSAEDTASSIIFDDHHTPSSRQGPYGPKPAGVGHFLHHGGVLTG
jgi:hypothetical protein